MIQNYEISNISKAIARESWTKEFFEELKNSHQIHYDQWGYIKGDLVIRNKKINFIGNSKRDHSFGQRDWSRFRYIVNFFSTSNGYRFYIAHVLLPTTTNLCVGYVFYPSGEYSNILHSSLDVVKCGLFDEPKNSYVFTIETREMTFSIFCEVETSITLNMNGAKIYERISKFRVNEIFEGIGISEFCMREKDQFKQVKNLPQVHPYDVETFVETKTPIIEVVKEELLFVSFEDEGKTYMWDDIHLIGGKASQLSFLYSRFKKNVPLGFCLTTNAQLEQDKKLMD